MLVRLPPACTSKVLAALELRVAPPMLRPLLLPSTTNTLPAGALALKLVALTEMKPPGALTPISPESDLRSTVVAVRVWPAMLAFKIERLERRKMRLTAFN